MTDSSPSLLRPRPLRGETHEATPGRGEGLTFELGIDSFFSASHAMRPEGERHTHSFRIQATFVTDAVDDDGMVVGFREVNDLLDQQTKRYANSYVNDLPPFDTIQPTGENIIRAVFRDLEASVEAELPVGLRLVAVTLWESPTSYVRVKSVEFERKSAQSQASR